MDKYPELRQVPTLTFRESLGCVRLVLWDERTRKLVPFPRRELGLARAR
jgi:omega-6 fatty acid desaturase (delta-12 desaturase)